MKDNRAEVFDEIIIDDINFINQKDATEKQEKFKLYKNIKKNHPN